MSRLKTVLLLLFTVSVSAAIGGITNYLAIRMLFRPKQKWVIWGRRVPFTPGLIPKRRLEIAASLGAVVEQHLVTSDGLRRVLGDSGFQQRIGAKINAAVDRWAESDETIEAWMERVWGHEQTARIKREVLETLKKMKHAGLQWLWETKEWKIRTLGQLVPGWTEERKLRAVQASTDFIVREVLQHLHTPEADRLIRRMASRFLDQAGGFLGTLAAIFVDEEKISRTIRQWMVKQLDTPAVRGHIDQFIEKIITEWEGRPLEELVQRFAGDQPPLEWLLQHLGGAVNEASWLEGALQRTFRDMFGNGRKEWVTERIPAIVGWGVSIVSGQVERIIAAINLENLVREQVQDFPIEQLENIVLSVSGKEFRAITWLGALLGGMIGLLQFIFLRLVA